ncbi:KilA-N domain-containing protein [Halomonas sp. QX-2]|uniref:KilA-N domain-containing protein n=1 Tax=Vreelandella sedimenti TaxID=2729618 RepID=A0A7Z0SR72_9GAMM|nr:KilA-N domain-containing protein [Halomonas sedimenti]NYT74274.1 KilA-N domain-containing protein [Halomonas sedimenti]
MSKKQQAKNEETPGAGTPEASIPHQTSTKGDAMNSSINSVQSCNFDTKLPVIAGYEITTDEQGRFSLNAIHKAGGAEKRKRPSLWIQNLQTKELIAEMIDQSRNSCFADSDQNQDFGLAPIEAKHGGRNPGTYAHELLAISYAGWISPKFQLQVNQVFLDYRMGKLQQAETKPTYEALPNPLTPAHQRGIQKAVGRRCFNFPEPARPKAYKRIYSHLKDRFGVAKYDQIPDERYTEALGAVESYSFNGDFLEAEALPETKQVKVLDLDAWLDMNFYIKHRQMDSRRVLITPKYLVDSEYCSPTLRLVKELEAEGHNLDACRLEVLSLRHHLSSCMSKIEQMMGVAQGINGQGVSFTRQN